MLSVSLARSLKAVRVNAELIVTLTSYNAHNILFLLFCSFYY